MKLQKLLCFNYWRQSLQTEKHWSLSPQNREGTEQIKQCECIWSTKANTDILWFYFEIAQFMGAHIFNEKILIHYQNGMPLTRSTIIQHLNVVKYPEESVGLFDALYY